MKTFSLKIALPGFAAVAAVAAAPALANPVSYEQERAEQEADLILQGPIGGIENDYWFNYLSDIGEARHELGKDLKHVSDSEDERDAFDEYRRELSDARSDYARQMREKGYRQGEVHVE